MGGTSLGRVTTQTRTAKNPLHCPNGWDYIEAEKTFFDYDTKIRMFTPERGFIPVYPCAYVDPDKLPGYVYDPNDAEKKTKSPVQFVEKRVHIISDPRHIMRRRVDARGGSQNIVQIPEEFECLCGVCQPCGEFESYDLNYDRVIFPDYERLFCIECDKRPFGDKKERQCDVNFFPWRTRDHDNSCDIEKSELRKLIRMFANRKNVVSHIFVQTKMLDVHERVLARRQGKKESRL
jgi:hypothetical protein